MTTFAHEVHTPTSEKQHPMLRTFFSRTLLATCLLSLLFINSTMAQSDRGFIDQDNYDSLLSGADNFGNDYNSLKQDVEQERQEFARQAQQRAQERKERDEQLDRENPNEDLQSRLTRKAIQFAIDDYFDEQEEKRGRIRGYPVPEPSFAKQAYRHTIKEPLAEMYGDDIKKAADAIQGALDDKIDDLADLAGAKAAFDRDPSFINGLRLAQAADKLGIQPDFGSFLSSSTPSSSPIPNQPRAPQLTKKKLIPSPTPPVDWDQVVDSWVQEQQDEWVRLADTFHGTNISREDQVTIFINTIAGDPNRFGPEILIQPQPVRSLTSDIPGVTISDGDLNDTGRTNKLLEEAIARQKSYNQTQIHPYLVSSQAPAVVHHSSTEVVAAPTVVHEGSVGVAAEPVVRAAPSVSVVTRRPRPVRPVVRATAATAAVAAETVVPRRRVVRRRPVVEAGAAVVAAPVVTVARARPVVRVRPVVRRPVVRARRVVARRGLR